MARKLQIRRGAKANMPVLAVGEFAMATDSGAEELRLGNGTKNLKIPITNDAGFIPDAVYTQEYYDDMNALTASGVYRVGANTNLDSRLWYGNVLVMIREGTDTIAQIGMDYASSRMIARSGQLVDGTWTFGAWAEAYTDVNKPTPADIGAAPAYTYGTTDIEAGSASPYETGHLHFVIE